MSDNPRNENRLPVSFIVPVYNVYEWLDACIESLVNQSFQEFEIILVDDGSTDGSKEKCMEWAKKDERIRVLTQENSGPSIARNYGIREAKGEYLSFIDSDDWVEADFLKEMYGMAEHTNADMVECDFWRYNNKTGNKTYHVCYGSAGKVYTKEEHMLYGHTGVMKCLIRRELFTTNGIWFPNCHSEVRAVYALLVALSNKIVNVQKALYYYRRFRENSLTQKPRNVDKNAIGVQAFIELMNGFKRCNIFEENKELLERILKFKLSDLLAGMFQRRTPEEFAQMISDYQQLITEMFPKSRTEKYITFGGYNLNRVTWQMNMLHIPSLRFNFSGIISIMHPVQTECEVVCKNKYRETMVKRDITSAFWEILEKEQPTYIILDFIEERFDIMECENGYLTVSDAYEECEQVVNSGKIIKRNSEVAQKLWESSCFAFIDKIQKYVIPQKIVLVKNYLSENVGNIESQVKFDDVEAIRETNRILEGYYDFFEKNCPGVKVVDATKCSYYFTDEKYEYGAIPSHLNELVNKEIADEIERECFK